MTLSFSERLETDLDCDCWQPSIQKSVADLFCVDFDCIKKTTDVDCKLAQGDFSKSLSVELNTPPSATIGALKERCANATMPDVVDSIRKILESDKKVCVSNLDVKNASGTCEATEMILEPTNQAESKGFEDSILLLSLIFAGCAVVIGLALFAMQKHSSFRRVFRTAKLGAATPKVEPPLANKESPRVQLPEEDTQSIREISLAAGGIEADKAQVGADPEVFMVPATDADSIVATPRQDVEHVAACNVTANKSLEAVDGSVFTGSGWGSINVIEVDGDLGSGCCFCRRDPSTQPTSQIPFETVTSNRDDALLRSDEL